MGAHSTKIAREVLVSVMMVVRIAMTVNAVVAVCLIPVAVDTQLAIRTASLCMGIQILVCVDYYADLTRAAFNRQADYAEWLGIPGVRAYCHAVGPAMRPVVVTISVIITAAAAASIVDHLFPSTFFSARRAPLLPEKPLR